MRRIAKQLLISLTLLAVIIAIFAVCKSATYYLMAQSAVTPYTIEMNLYDLTSSPERWHKIETQLRQCIIFFGARHPPN
jgi:hypothetical protein